MTHESFFVYFHSSKRGVFSQNSLSRNPVITDPILIQNGLFHNSVITDPILILNILLDLLGDSCLFGTKNVKNPYQSKYFVLQFCFKICI